MSETTIILHMKMKQINLVALLQPYTSGWVAISADFSKVLLWGKTLLELKEKVRDKKEKIYYFPAGESYANFVGVQ